MIKNCRAFACMALLVWCFIFKLNAQTNPSYTAIAVSLKSTTAVTIGSFNFPTVGKTYAQPLLRERNSSAKLYFKLDLGNDYVKNGVNWNFKIQVDLSYQLGANPAVSKTLIIDQKKPELLKMEDLLAEFNSTVSFSPLSVSISSVGITDGSNNPITNNLLLNFINSNVRLTSTLERQYEVDVRHSTVLMSNSPVISPVSITGRLVTFSWTPSGVDAYPNYEVQILKLYNIDPALQTNTNTIASDIDWTRALKVETQKHQTNVRLTMAEGTGYYIWRVRPIGTYFKGGIANVENYGSWSYSLPTSTSTTVFNKSSLTGPSNPTPYAFHFTDPDENINWIYSRVFTEGDNVNKGDPTGLKSSEGITYANGLLITRQTQKYNSSENTNIVSQTGIDYSGRTAMSTVPVPLSGQLTGYKFNFVKNTAGALYTAVDFDADANLNSPDQVKDNGANNPFSYYSNNSTIPNGIDNTNVPNAEGYAFKRTIFKSDGTNRVSEESGVGKAHSLGLISNGQGRTTQILYGTPSEDELIRIFGDEAPLANSVIKTFTKDQNDVVSVTYTSKEGKTIATALVSDNASNLNVLQKAAVNTTVTNSISENISTGGKLVASKRLVIPNNNTVIKMSYANNTLPGNSGTVCPTGDCGLRMRFYLTDLKQGIVYVSVNSNVTPYFTPSGSFTFPAGWKFVSQSIINPATITPTGAGNDEITLNFGEYLLVKEIYSGNSSTYGEDLVSGENDKTRPVIDALMAIMKGVNSEAAYNSFVALTNTLITEMNIYNTNNVLTPAASATLFSILKMDVTALPTGYYFPIASEFTIAPITTNTLDPSLNDFEIKTGCCGSIKAAIPGKPICYLCDGTPDPAVTATTIAGMIAANNNLSNLITPYGINDFKAEATWTTLSTNAKVAAITGLVERELVEPLKAKLTEEGFNVNADLWKFIPGLSYEGLNSMFANMLISQYYTGNAIKHSDNQWYAATYNSTTNGYTLTVPVNSLTNIPYNYDCQKMVDAWRDAIELINGFETGGDDNILSAFNSDGTQGSGQDNSEDQNNWNIDLEPLKKILKKAISKRLEEFNDSDDGKMSGARKESATSVINSFMKDVGYQFEAVIDGSDLPNYIGSGTSPLPTNYATFSIAPTGPGNILTSVTVGSFNHTNVPLLFQTNGTLSPITYTWNCTAISGPTVANELYYANILKPEWMFRYFVYNVFENQQTGFPAVNFIDDNSLLIPNQVSIDILRKYNLPYSYLTAAMQFSTTPQQLCSTPASQTYSLGANTFTFNYLHENWTVAERVSFYNAIKGASKCYGVKGIDPGDDLTDPPNQLPTCKTKQEMYDIVISDLDYRISAVKNMKPTLINALTSELTAACYTIVACKVGDGGGQVTEKEIDLMASTVIKQAEDQIKYVKTTFTAAITNTTNVTACTHPSLFVLSYGNGACDLPACAEVDCREIVLYNNNTIDLKSSRNIYSKLYRDCDQKILDMIGGATFLPDIAPYGNCTKPDKLWKNCPDGPECTSGHPYKEKTPCTQAEYNAYSKKFTVQATGN
jgi:hypothetical protein